MSAARRPGVCNTSGSGTDLPAQSDVAQSHGPLPQNSSLFMGFAFMLTASSEIDRLTNRPSSDDDEEGEAGGGPVSSSFRHVDIRTYLFISSADFVQTGPYNKAYTESQLQAGGGFILADFNEEQVL